MHIVCARARTCHTCVPGVHDSSTTVVHVKYVKNDFLSYYYYVPLSLAFYMVMYLLLLTTTTVY
jgi:hypothetical protein